MSQPLTPSPTLVPSPLLIPGLGYLAEPLATPVYSLGLWSANVTDVNGVRWGVSSTTGWYDGASVRLNQSTMPRYDGAFRSQSYRSVRTVVLNGWAEAPNKRIAEQARTQFVGLIAGGGQQQLVVRDDYTTRTMTVELGSDPKCKPDGPFSFDWQLTLVAADPRKYWDQSVTASTPLPSIASGLDWATGGGLNWATGGGLNWGTSVSDGTITLSNPGTAETWPTITLTGQLTSPVITNRATGQRLAYSGTLAMGDQVVITASPYGRSVLLNGTTDRRSYLTSAQWFPVPPGGSATFQLSSSLVSDTGTLSGSILPADW